MNSNTGKILTVAFVATGILVLVKNYDRDGFWVGALAALLVSGAIGIKISN